MPCQPLVTIRPTGRPDISEKPVRRSIAGLRLQTTTIEDDQKIIRNHVTLYLGAIQLDKLTTTGIAARCRQLETSGRGGHR